MRENLQFMATVGFGTYVSLPVSIEEMSTVCFAFTMVCGL